MAPPRRRSGDRGSATRSRASGAAVRRSRTSGCAASAGKRSQGAAFFGEPPAEIAITEDEARFIVDVRAGQKTGFFLDQRDNRRMVRRHAAGASVLNLYCYTGGFSLHAALGGASHVTSVDIAPAAIADLQKNVALSGLPTDGHETACEDVFEFLDRARARSGAGIS